jgi:hypothetical protein
LVSEFLGVGITPAVANGILYTAATNSATMTTNMYAFDASGATGCAGTPKTCMALLTVNYRFPGAVHTSCSEWHRLRRK